MPFLCSPSPFLMLEPQLIPWLPIGARRSRECEGREFLFHLAEAWPRRWGQGSVTGVGCKCWARGPRKYWRESRDSTKLFMSSGSPLTCSPGSHCSPMKLILISIPNIFEISADWQIGRSLPRSPTDHKMVTDPSSIVKPLKTEPMLESPLTELVA